MTNKRMLDLTDVRVLTLDIPESTLVSISWISSLKGAFTGNIFWPEREEKMSRETPEQYAQGDLLFERIRVNPMSPPVENNKAEILNGNIVLARGERTGHAHVVDADKARLMLGGNSTMILRVIEDTEVRHKEVDDITLIQRIFSGVFDPHTHEALPLAAGDWQVRQQTDYVPEKQPVTRARWD